MQCADSTRLVANLWQMRAKPTKRLFATGGSRNQRKAW
jgi:hypothetical protein